MSGVPASSRGFSGGAITQPTTFTAPVTIDLTADLADRTALDVIQPATFGFGVRPFRFRQTDFAYFQMETTGILSTAGNDLSTAGGSLTARGGNANVTKSDGTPEHVLGSDPVAGFFGVNPVAQPAAIANATGGVVIDAEARAALNSLLAAIRTLGLTAT